MELDAETSGIVFQEAAGSGIWGWEVGFWRNCRRQRELLRAQDCVWMLCAPHFYVPVFLPVRIPTLEDAMTRLDIQKLTFLLLRLLFKFKLYRLSTYVL